MQELVKAGHAFASQAFARIAPISGKSNEELDAIEHAVIYDLQPFINKRHKLTPNYLEVTHELSPTEHDWLQSWRATHKSLVEQGIQTGHRGKVIKEPIPPKPPEPPTCTAAQLDGLRRRLLHVLDTLDSLAERDEERGIGGHIARLSREGKIPRDVAACMRSVTEARNMVVYQRKTLTTAQCVAVNAAWEVVKEWAAAQGIKIPE